MSRRWAAKRRALTEVRRRTASESWETTQIYSASLQRRRQQVAVALKKGIIPSSGAENVFSTSSTTFVGGGEGTGGGSSSSIELLVSDDGRRTLKKIRTLKMSGWCLWILLNGLRFEPCFWNTVQGP